ncbi:modification methylase, partial [bacterium]
IMNTGEENEGIRYKNTPHGRPIINGKEKYLRILIKNKGI